MKKPITIAACVLTACAAMFAQSDYPQLSDIPTLYIETENGAKIQDKNGDYVRAVLHLVDGEETTVYDALGIRGRGNSTWGLPKKPYKIKFDKKQELLGPDRAKAKSWVLLANHADKTLMRNAVAANIGTIAGQPFTAAVKFVDVVLNNKYIGNYQISDQVEVRKKRVDIVEQEEPATEESNITGGYFLEVDGFATSEPVYITTHHDVKITIKSPDEEIINQAQINYIRDYINKFEDALFSDDFTDPESGYRQYIDESTLASWYIASELTGNVDAFWSTYIYKNQDDPKIYWGPLWDYDIAFNNCNRTGEVTNKLMRDAGFGTDLTGKWVRRLWQDPWFVNLINDNWQALVADGIEQKVLDYIDEQAQVLQQSQALNFGIWPLDQRVYNEIKLFSTYDEGVDYLKAFITGHVAYLTREFERSAATMRPPEPFVPEYGFYYTITNKGNGRLADYDSDAEGLCIRQADNISHSQHWQLVPHQNGLYYIVNCLYDMAVTDVAPENNGSFTGGQRLTLQPFDRNDERQMWTIELPSNDNGVGYIIKNHLTHLVWNNQGGSNSDGNPIISWTSDQNNASKPTRQWLFARTDEAYTGINGLPDNAVEYMVAYRPDSKTLCFYTGEDDTLTGTASLYTPNGRLVRTFDIAPTVDLSTITPGIYILTWTTDARTHSSKLSI